MTVATRPSIPPARYRERLDRAVRATSDAGRRVLAVGQHDDAELRRRALAAGADRVHPYRKLFEDGPGTLATWLEGTPTRPGTHR